MLFFFFFFKQKTAYEIYQCDWSSDVCSSDLLLGYTNELNEINRLISQFNSFLSTLHNLNEFEIRATGENFINESIALLKKIDEILTKISRDLEIGDFKVQNFSSR